jgi:hypothetical protein
MDLNTMNGKELTGLFWLRIGVGDRILRRQARSSGFIICDEFLDYIRLDSLVMVENFIHGS